MSVLKKLVKAHPFMDLTNTSKSNYCVNNSYDHPTVKSCYYFLINHVTLKSCS